MTILDYRPKDIIVWISTTGVEHLSVADIITEMHSIEIRRFFHTKDTYPVQASRKFEYKGLEYKYC